MTAEHLRCTRCHDRVGVARIDGKWYHVCHCTHEDGEIRPLDYGNLMFMPDRWGFVSAGAPSSNHGETGDRSHGGDPDV